MKKYVLFAFVALFFVSSSGWANTAYVKLTAKNGTASWIPIAGNINGKNIEIFKLASISAIDNTTEGSIDLRQMWSESGGKGTQYQVTKIGMYAFYQCRGLTSVTIPSTVTSIGGYAFSGCSGMTSVTIPSSVTSIGSSILSYCDGLASIVVESGNKVYDSRNNCKALIETASNTLIAGCKNTKIPSTVTSIKDYAFSHCSGLTSINIPNGVTSIGEGAFFSCENLTSITIGKSVSSISDNAFFLCVSLNSIVVESGNKVYDSRNNCNAIIETASNTLIKGCLSTKIPNSVTSIGHDAFHFSNGLTSMKIPNSVTSIGSFAFAYCYDLKSVVIPSSVTSIGEYAFYGCYAMTSITSHITNVFKTGDVAFEGCEYATLYVPKGTKSQYQSTADWNRISKIEEMTNPYDVNNDGSIDISDVVVLVNAILSSSTTNNSYDVNGDGSVDISDVVSLVNKILG